MTTNQQTYRVRVTVCGGDWKRTAYVTKRDGANTWDGAWYTTHQMGQVKTWKTRAGAQRWLDARTTVKELMAGTVEEVR